jgi:hypothetical protein
MRSAVVAPEAFAYSLVFGCDGGGKVMEKEKEKRGRRRRRRRRREPLDIL